MQISDKEHRRSEYLASAGDEAFLRALNERLAETPRPGAVPERPVVFVAGAPRSGTTVLAQAVTSYFKVGFVDGLAARLWLAPVTGFRLSRAVAGGGRASAFTSEYGRAALFDIHSFHYFWMHHLKLEGVADLFTSPEARGVDWTSLLGHLAALEQAARGPFAFKGYYPSYFMRDFCAQIPGAVFIIVRRDPLAVAESIYEARIAYHGDPAAWYSLQPPGVEALAGLPPEDQIAGQIIGLNAHFDDQIGRAGKVVRVIEADYDRFVEDPAATLEEIGAAVARLTGMRIEATGDLPKVRRREAPKVAPDVTDRLQRALRRRTAG